MSVVVFKKRFESPPSKDEILGLMTGEMGDKTKAKDALLEILTPMKDLLALLNYVEALDATAGKYADLLKEQDVAANSVATLKAQTAGANANYDAAAQRVTQITKQIADLEAKRDAVISEIESEEQAKLRVNKAVSDEYDRLRADMVAQVKGDEAKASKKLKELEAKIMADQEALDAMAEKKRLFIASLGS